MRNSNSPWFSLEETSSLPVCLQKACMSLSEPGSVATMARVSPLARSVRAFLVRRMGSGQFMPRASRVWVAFVLMVKSPRVDDRSVKMIGKIFAVLKGVMLRLVRFKEHGLVPFDFAQGRLRQAQ